MLRWLRSNSRNAFIYVLFLLLIASFVVTLAGGRGSRGRRDSNDISVVYGAAIDRKTFSNALSDRERQYEKMLGAAWTDKTASQLHLPEMVLGQLEDELLLKHGARALGLEVTDTELKDHVIRLPGLTNGGAFDYARYKRALAYQRKTPKQFEEQLRDEMLLDKMQQFLADSAQVSRAEVLESYRQAREKVDLEYVALTLDAYRKAIHPTDEELKTFMVKASSRIESYYKTHPSEFKRPAQTRASHILVKVSPNDPEDKRKEAERKAAALATEARRPHADFAALAKKNSEDPGSAREGGALGWLSPGQTVKPFDEALSSSKPGQVVGPIKTDFGWHVILVQEKRPAMDRKIEQSRPDIARNLLTDDRAEAAAKKEAEAILAKAKGAKDLGSVPLPAGAETGTTGSFTRDAISIPKLGASAELLTLAFSLTPESPLAPTTVRIGEKLVVARLRSRISAPQTPLEENLAPVRERLLSRKQQQAIQLWLQAERARARAENEFHRNEEALRDLTGA